MSECIYQAVGPEFFVECMQVGDGAPIDSDVNAEVNRIWSAALDEHQGQLFNGSVLGLIGVHDNVLVGKRAEYKMFYAGLEQPSIFAKVGAPVIVAVSGCMHHRGRWLIGRRSKSLTQYRDCLEFVPSGSLDYIMCSSGKCDFRLQLLRELFEETGWQIEGMPSMTPFAVIHDIEGHVADICVQVSLPSEPELGIPEPTKEYSDFYWMDSQEVLSKMDTDIDSWVPTSVCIAHESPLLSR